MKSISETAVMCDKYINRQKYSIHLSVLKLLVCEQAKHLKKEIKNKKQGEVSEEQGQRSMVAHSREV